MTARVAIVTGGSRGIGRAACLQLARTGYAVVVNYAVNAEAAAWVVDAITGSGGRAIAVQADVSREDDILRLFAAADRLGPLNLLVNNAGVIDLAGRVDQMSAERLARTFGINLTGAFLCAREAVRRMSSLHGGSGGSVVNLSSAAAIHGAPASHVDYAASKAAIDLLTIGLAREVAAEGIRVNAVRPGIIDTEIHASGGMPGRVAALRDSIPMKREGTPEEVAEAICWLASDAATYVTGAILNVAGGRC